MDYSPLIETILKTLGKKYKVEDNKFITQNPILDDSSPSAIFYSDGWLLSLNGNILENRNRLFIKEVCLLTGYISLYIEFMMLKNNIPSYKLNSYREILIQNKNSKEMSKLFYEMGIYKNDILGMSYLKPINTNKFTHQTVKSKKIPPKEVEQTADEYDKCIEYMKSRKLELSKICYPSTLLIQDKYRYACVKIAYQNGYAKFRLLQGDLRYLTSTEKGEYGELLEVMINKSNIALVLEGEFNSISLAQCKSKDYDIYAMNNLNSLPKTEQLKDYDKVIVMIDKDKYDNVKQGLENNIRKLTKDTCDISVIYAFEDESMDLNEYLIKNNLEILKKYVDNRINI